MSRPADGRSESYRRIYAVVRRIPRGRVATYGQVAALAGLGPHARQVGYALHALRDGDGVPWHRVVNARGGVSPRAEPGAAGLQRARLEAEGVRFGPDARIDLSRHQWRPRSRAPGARRSGIVGLRATRRPEEVPPWRSRSSRPDPSRTRARRVPCTGAAGDRAS